jgi:two-component system, OmpR family, sensor histidine kinase KdpD
VQDRPAAREFGKAAAGLAGLALVIWALRGVQELPNPAIAALLLLLVILITATAVRVQTAIAVSVVATAAFNFFLLPPFNTFTLADAQNWVALFVFLAVAIIASQLSAAVRARAREAMARRDELARLFDLSRDVLVMSDSREAISSLARSVARRFDLEYVAIALPTSDDWATFEAGAQTIQLDKAQLTDAFASAQLAYEFDAYARTYAGHRSLAVDSRPVRLVPLRVGAKPIGLLAASGRPIESGTLDALAGVVAIAIERAKMLEERKEAELTRQSEELKTALLASLGHDLRTPLTAIRVAASNIKAPSLTPDDRSEQSDLILGEAERLTRLFQNILDMARIDAGAIETESRWTHPSEIVAAARDQTQYALQQHRVEVSTDPDIPVRLDPRLTAIAVAHLLENASKFAPSGSMIELRTRVTDDGLLIEVRDHGPGITPADLPHVFDRFYRGAPSKARVSGTGMGLWIARGLLAAQQGRIRVETCTDGGARFTIAVPAEVKHPARAAVPER